MNAGVCVHGTIGSIPGQRRLAERRTAAAWIVVVVIGAIGVGGCSCRREDKWSRQRPPTYPASGSLLVDGKPVEGVKVQFERPPAADGRPWVAFGYTDARGRFRLQTFRDGDGAVEGEQNVLVEWITVEQLPKPAAAEVAPTREVSHLPARYRSSKTSGLTATVVPGGRNQFSFSITTQEAD